ncbi:hypothetical protein GCM10027612_76360 [Microbispora bryophytorum subsp. camponoti]
MPQAIQATRTTRTTRRARGAPTTGADGSAPEARGAAETRQARTGLASTGTPFHNRRRKHDGFPAAWTGTYSHRLGYFINPARGPQTRAPTTLTRNNYSKD